MWVTELGERENVFYYYYCYDDCTLLEKLDSHQSIFGTRYPVLSHYKGEKNYEKKMLLSPLMLKNMQNPFCLCRFGRVTANTFIKMALINSRSARPYKEMELRIKIHFSRNVQNHSKTQLIYKAPLFKVKYFQDRSQIKDS